MSECNNKGARIKKIIFYKASDFKEDEHGNMVLKRKYGKFKREAFSIYYDQIPNTNKTKEK